MIYLGIAIGIILSATVLALAAAGATGVAIGLTSDQDDETSAIEDHGRGPLGLD